MPVTEERPIRKAPPPGTPERARGAREWLRGGPMRRQLLATGMAFVAVTVMMALLSPRFATPGNLTNILIQASIFFVLAAGMTLVLNSGGIDLSVGSLAALAASIFGGLFDGGASWPLAAAAAGAVGLAGGLFNGFVITLLRVPPIITTLGTFVAFRGLALVYLEGQVKFGFPPAFLVIARGDLVGVPVPVFIGAGVLLVVAYVLRKTVYGRSITAIGGNQQAAHLAGINVDRSIVGVYAINGFLAGLAGIMLVARLDAAQASLGSGMELHVIAAVVIGGTSLFGGSSTVLGTALGVLLIGVLENGLLLAGVSPFWQRVFLGVLIIAAVAIRTAGRKKTHTLM